MVARDAASAAIWKHQGARSANDQTHRVRVLRSFELLRDWVLEVMVVVDGRVGDVHGDGAKRTEKAEVRYCWSDDDKL